MGWIWQNYKVIQKNLHSFFFYDLDGHIEDPKVQKSLEDLGLHCQDFHVLGVFEADLREKIVIFSCRLENNTAIIPLRLEVDTAWTRPDLNGSSRKDSNSGSSLLHNLNE